MGLSPADYKMRTLNAYDALSADLAQGFDRFFDVFAQEQAAQFLYGLDPNGLILDLGCGGGPASSYFIQRGYATISADLSAGMLQECRKRGLSDLVRLDLEELPFRRGVFAGIWAHTSLLQVPKARLAGVLQALAEALQPGGRLFVALKEGGGEDYQGRSGAERWFAHFGATEFEDYVPGQLQVTRRARTELRRTTFLSYRLARQG
jgi:SAM-dependent methyltransferase